MATNILVSGDTVTYGDKTYPCAVGRGGIVSDKREADGATPAGIFPLRRVFYRADRLEKPETELRTVEIEPGFAWCDDPADTRYNTLVTGAPAEHPESLFRDDSIYDVVVEIGYNDDPVVPGKGSAIFLHTAKNGYLPTAGCVALRLEDLLELLGRIESSTKIEIRSY